MVEMGAVLVVVPVLINIVGAFVLLTIVRCHDAKSLSKENRDKKSHVSHSAIVILVISLSEYLFYRRCDG